MITQNLNNSTATCITAGSLAQQSLQQMDEQQLPQNNDDVLMVRHADHWMAEAHERAIPLMLFGKFWHQGEVCILFADSNLGKSIVAVQVADGVSKGSGKYPFDVEAPAQPVLYCDFELTDKQFEARYSVDYEYHYHFGKNFYRAELNPDMELPHEFADFDDYLIYSLERSVLQTGAKVLVIDNLTYLRSETERAKDALPLMKQLKALKNKYNLSILVLAHTPKRDMAQPITRNDLQGSKMLMNFCDSAFAIGESKTDVNMRYLKQIKQRNTEQLYGEGNVCLCQIGKPYNFLKYEFVSFGKEWEQLSPQNDPEQEQIMANANELKQQGLTLRQIGQKLGISHQKADRLLKAYAKLNANV
ncbi:AAA family ATPase [Mucilaginibacter rubeus]|uniref:AAA family ATPase n=1 Tax=Mucilaginibacter rubeus TaxID=2027860 RepID=A0AAE6MGC8_9SPHI|nr:MULTISPECIES: AAA family ATPase [Mucilaginibacter]QEM02376.1 AAA family ATPase [Mucilaginibacter rubeus]QEM15001.1 AAA family ATPase [Mucilaginibacter gossypii]QTE42282.1 AAA family ATPase [Mucilaginibacter rubeus]QTE48883.1 AAA family ATPase [Mucilaginibacter rubeus]QTE53981.1 AAA family ATPase [Mucilaginibacter rubeus]